MKAQASDRGSRGATRCAITTAMRCTPTTAMVAMVMLLLAANLASAQTAREAFVDSVLTRMTLEEKLGQLNQLPSAWSDTGPRAQAGGEDEVRAGRVGSFLSMWGADNTLRLQRIAVEESRLGIPLLFAHDVIHGFRTIFPVPIGETSTWDTVAVRDAARIAAREAAASGIHLTYAPMVDIARDARWGRIVEGAGEDPFLGQAMAAARVRGFQGQHLASDSTVGACVKHFVGYGAAEGGRDYDAASIPVRVLNDIYLPPFEAAIQAGAVCVMAAFNEVDGVPMHAHEMALRGILRDAWGFGGIVISDYTGVLELMAHGIAATRAEAGRKALAAGVDVDMVSRIYVDSLGAEVQAGRLDEALVDEAVRRVLLLKHDLGLFANPYAYSDAARQQARTLTPEYRQAAREVARKSLVLLKNDGTLPLSKTAQRVAVIGPLATDARSTIGNWAAVGRADEAVTVLEGLRRALPGATVAHLPGIAAPTSMDTTGIGAAVALARASDATVLVLGEHQEMSAEAFNRTTLDLPGAQQQLADAVIAAGKPVAIVLMAGRPLSTVRLDSTAGAILMAWFPGTEGGSAVADVLLGEVSPSGRMPLSVPYTVGQVPIYYNRHNTGRPYTPASRFNLRYVDAPTKPLYPFGHGLTYTTFRYDDLRVSAPTLAANGTLEVTVRLTNTGAREGTEVVQLYVHDEAASVARPVRELKGFRRMTLAPGASQNVTFVLTADDLAFTRLDYSVGAEPGLFTVYVGPNAAEGLHARFSLEAR